MTVEIQEKKICHWMAELLAAAVWKKQLSALRAFMKGPQGFLMVVHSLSVKKKKCLTGRKDWSRRGPRWGRLRVWVGLR
jgi:hypothetical protein